MQLHSSTFFIVMTLLVTIWRLSAGQDQDAGNKVKNAERVVAPHRVKKNLIYPEQRYETLGFTSIHSSASKQPISSILVFDTPCQCFCRFTCLSYQQFFLTKKAPKMSIPTTQKQWITSSTDKDFDGLVYQTSAPVPKPSSSQVLVRIHGASLNYRDLIIPRGTYPFPLDLPVVSLSDGAGEVVAVGSDVTKFKVGDKVLTLFNQGHQKQLVDVAASKTGLGGCIDGTLREYATFAESGVVKMPENLDYVEAASLVCAGLTSWNALFGLRPLEKGQWVLVQGTGGVSLFALQVCKTFQRGWVRIMGDADLRYSLPRLPARRSSLPLPPTRSARSSRSWVPITLSITSRTPTGARLPAS